ncbi:MAG: TetR/AcrR family transcriptional regulator [Lentisphaerae bacterium]|nr:TetR/AcrR family transcriptional regulator [Lentisphaerota bacterium]
MQIKIKTEIRQEQIRKAAIQLISEVSLNNLTIADIADKIGVTKSNIYRHFPSKIAIIEDIIKMIDFKLQKIILDSETIKDPSEKLRNIFLSHIKLLKNCNGAPLFIFTDKLCMSSSNIKSVMQNTVNTYTQQINGIISEGIEYGNFKNDIDIKTAVEVYLGLIQSVIFQWLVSNGAFSPAARGEKFWEIFLNGVTE